jgi:hypothetical protein
MEESIRESREKFIKERREMWRHLNWICPAAQRVCEQFFTLHAGPPAVGDPLTTDDVAALKGLYAALFSINSGSEALQSWPV